jgi:plastocyanin
MLKQMNIKKLKQASKPQLALMAGSVLLMAFGVWLLVIALHPAKTNSGAGSQQTTIAVVEINAGGFTPATIKVQPGTKVVWVNKDQAPHQIAADPYPSHAELPALVSPRATGFNQTYSFVFTKTRTLHYHDELNPTLEGVVEVSTTTN